METLEQILDRALASKSGLKLTFSSAEGAKSLRSRCYKVMQRERNKVEAETGLFESPWDNLTFKLQDNSLHIVPGIPGIESIEEL